MIDIAIIGAGPAGIGIGILLQKMGIKNFRIFEQYDIGSSFRHWPKEMRFITPSFNGNDFGAIDLNSITPEISPGELVQEEHLSGSQYVEYLKDCVESFNIPISVDTKIVSVKKRASLFHIETSQGSVKAKFLIWARGEFWFPDKTAFPGAKLCRHNTQVRSWEKLAGEEFIVLGGYESGIDAAYHLVQRGKRVTVIDRALPWKETSPDPSRALSVYTKRRLQEALATKRLTLVGQKTIQSIRREKDGLYRILSEDGRAWQSITRPILATGFSLVGNPLIETLFTRNEQGQFALNEYDESLSTPGVFLVGPSLRQQDLIFCFIYKFRGRFPIVAQAIAKRLHVKAGIPPNYQRSSFLIDDLSCCGGGCDC